jgi:hypothetical protein
VSDHGHWCHMGANKIKYQITIIKIIIQQLIDEIFCTCHITYEHKKIHYFNIVIYASGINKSNGPNFII